MTRDSRPAAPAPAVTRPGPGQPLSRAADLIRAEWIKLWSARTTYIALAAAAVATALIPLVVAHADVAYLQAGSPHGRTNVNAVALSFRGLAISQLLVATLGALTVTGEYANGAIRTTFAAVPQRGAVIAAKVTVLCVVVLAFGQAIAFGCFLATQVILQPVHLGQSLRSAHVLGAVLGAGAYLPVAAAIGVGIGTLARRTATALGTIVVLLFLLPGVASAFPAPWGNRISNALPSTAAQAISAVRVPAGMLTARAAALSLACYAVLLPAAAIVALRRRDI
jgi:hypothetical protein